jgi:hypothetical protein
VERSRGMLTRDVSDTGSLSFTRCKAEENPTQSGSSERAGLDSSHVLNVYTRSLDCQSNGLLKLVTTINYSAVANSHTLQFTTARTKAFQPAVSSHVVAW